MPKIKNLSNVNVGSSANDGTGDLIREAFVKVNNSINAIYSNGQFVAYSPDTKLTPGFTWTSDKDTGMYRPGSGKIAFALNGNESLVLSEDTTLTWFGREIADKQYVNAKLLEYIGLTDLQAATAEISELPVSNTITNAVIIVTDDGGNVLANSRITTSGIISVGTLPTLGNYEGRTAFYKGDVWIFSGYPAGNGAGLLANPEIGRLAGSDYRWVRFRGTTGITFGASLPAVGFEGQQFYNTATDVLYYYLEGTWKTAEAVVNATAPTGIEILASLPLVSDPSNYLGRTVAVGNSIFVFSSGAWKNLNTYSLTSGEGILSGGALPTTTGRVKGELYRKTGTAAGLYIFNGLAWVKIESYTNASQTAGIREFSSVPVDLQNYTAGDVVLVGGELYRLNAGKTAWDLFRLGAANSVTSVQVSANGITTVKIADGAVTSAKIASNTITSTKLSSNAVTRTKIQPGAIGTIELGANAVTHTKLAAGAVRAVNIQNSSISTEQIAPAAVTGAKIAAGAITSSKLSVNTLSQISVNAGNISAGVFKSADNKMIIDLNNKIFRLEI